MRNADPEELLPLTPAVFHILLVLADGERHGYAIMQEVNRDTQGQIHMGPGTLYGTIKRLIAAGLNGETAEHPSPKIPGEGPRLYPLYDPGAQHASAETV